jgi:hypothetical protein
VRGGLVVGRPKMMRRAAVDVGGWGKNAKDSEGGRGSPTYVNQRVSND